MENPGEFEEFEEFMRKLRLDSLKNEEEFKDIPKVLIFNLKMNVPIEFSLMLQSVIYAEMYQN